MQEMKYQCNHKEYREVLDTGFCFGLLYYILNLGLFPTAYVKIPEGHALYGKSVNEININAHGGINFSHDSLQIRENERVKGWFIGWDYAHAGDYIGSDDLLPPEFRTSGKKWTTQEIYKEVREVCYQIKEAELNDNSKSR